MLTILKSLVQPRLDYCSQLWSPSDQGSINKIESIQYNLVNRIRDDKLTSLNYWEKLQELKLYSQERRRERYQVIFLWKICQGLVSGYDVEFTSGGTRRGRLGVPKIVPKNCPAVVRRARENSLVVKGVNIFNLLPESIRTIRSQHVDYFKNHLDIYLSSIPDQHTISGLGRAAPSNSLLHQIQMFKWEHWCKTILRGVQD